MAFQNVRLDDDVERGAQGGPGFKTTILELASGFEQRNIDWERARGRWDLSYGMDSKANQEVVLAFFFARQGRANGFRFKDWTDFQIGSDNPSDVPQEIFITDGAKTKFQVVRRYTSGPTTFDREVTRLVAGTVRVFLDAVEQFAGFTIDIETGVITFSVAPTTGQALQIICEFDVPVRFDIDELDLRAVRDDAFDIPQVPIVELRENLVDVS